MKLSNLKEKMMKLMFFKSRKFILFLFDILCFLFINTCYIIGVKLDGSLHLEEQGNFLTNFLVLTVLLFSFRAVFGFYKNIWKKPSLKNSAFQLAHMQIGSKEEESQAYTTFLI